ncbi:type ISP restriction/modification enzyme [Streptomyces montanisoli]|uniref:DNA methyltransferase n=1 Tax=Streptomyces montanisoli TaxID=2798581 RepID=A0A940MAK8_9ACTN|nr:type ISP restriction/modification enzyme [Streptomyces montanisoli]MBP0457774.1 DNA methyltransferase [Streptomyces montanisoli]
MPWSVAPLRLGRTWAMAPDAASLTARWDRLVRAEGAERDALFAPSRARTQHTPVAALPGGAPSTTRFAREDGRCPPPLRVAHGPFDEQWLIPDHRLIDVARPELWRVADEHQVFAVEQGHVPGDEGPSLLVSATLPDGRSPAGRPGRIRPLYRRPGGTEANIAPGLTALLSARHGRDVGAYEVLAWALAAARTTPRGCAVPLPSDAALWERGVELGGELARIQTRGARGGERPRLPGGRRPYVRAALPARPGGLTYSPEDETLHVGDAGRISPVPEGAWAYRAGGVRVLELWFERRTARGEPGTLDAIVPAVWPQAFTSELLELITVLALLADLAPRQEALRAELGAGRARTTIGRAELRAAGVLPVPAAARRPASVLDHYEEGPDGQFALI